MRVFLFRGLAGAIFSTGIDVLAAKLRAAGHQATVHSWLERVGVQSRAIADFKAGHLTGPIATIGHSLGGNSANYMGNNLIKAGVPVSYVATIDPTEPQPAPKGAFSDNFRSSDFRAEIVKGAVDHFRPELSHIQIDKDGLVHKRILAALTSAPTPSPTDPTLPPIDPTPVPGNQRMLILLQQLLHYLGDDRKLSEEEIRKLLAALLHGNSSSLSQKDVKDEKPSEDPMPVKNALGTGIGNLLDGRKTGLGILGLLATTLVPTFFPQLSGIKSLLSGLNMATDVANPGTGLFGPIFAALTGWGLLGKVEKWVKK